MMLLVASLDECLLRVGHMAVIILEVQGSPFDIWADDDNIVY